VSEAAPLILASGSPRRREILAMAGIPFTVQAADIPEDALPGESPHELVTRLAREKAYAIDKPPGAVLGADTVVVLGSQILGKPQDSEDARRMLRLLSAREHEVVTGFCLRFPDDSIEEAERTRVVFNTLSEDEIAAYVATGEPMDKAGAYAIQGLASKFIRRIEGCYFNVVGLPVARVYGHLKEYRRGVDGADC